MTQKNDSPPNEVEQPAGEHRAVQRIIRSIDRMVADRSVEAAVTKDRLVTIREYVDTCIGALDG